MGEHRIGTKTSLATMLVIVLVAVSVVAFGGLSIAR